MSNEKYKITYNGEEVIFNDQFSILDCLEDEGFDPDYSCRAGSCETCKLKVVNGTFEWVQPPLMTMEAGSLLACSTIPTSDIVLETVQDD